MFTKKKKKVTSCKISYRCLIHKMLQCNKMTQQDNTRLEYTGSLIRTISHVQQNFALKRRADQLPDLRQP